MNTIVTGASCFDDIHLMDWVLKGLPWTITRIISGASAGADSLGERWAGSVGVPVVRFPGLEIRHEAQMNKIEGMCQGSHALEAFWDGECIRTRMLIQEASARKLVVVTHIYKHNASGEPRRMYGAIPEDALPPF